MPTDGKIVAETGLLRNRRQGVAALLGSPRDRIDCDQEPDMVAASKRTDERAAPRIVAVSPDDGSAIDLRNPALAALLSWCVPGLGQL